MHRNKFYMNLNTWSPWI